MTNIRIKLLVKKFFKVDLWQYVLILSLICAIAFIFDKWVEAFSFCVAHYILRPKFDKQYHSYNTKICLLITSAVAFIGIMLTLPVHISLLSSIPVALFICWVGNLVQDRIDLTLYNKQYKLKIDELEKPKPFDLDNCTEIELRERCKLKGYKPKKIERAVVHFIHKTEHKLIDPVRPESSENERYRMRKDLIDL